MVLAALPSHPGSVKPGMGVGVKKGLSRASFRAGSVVSTIPRSLHSLLLLVRLVTSSHLFFCFLCSAGHPSMRWLTPYTYFSIELGPGW